MFISRRPTIMLHNGQSWDICLPVYYLFAR